MHMAVHDRLCCRLAAVHANVETFDGLVSSKDVCPDLIEKQIDRAVLNRWKTVFDFWSCDIPASSRAKANRSCCSKHC
jgi:hypothetical protein